MMASLKLYLLLCTSALAQLSRGQDQNATQAVEEVNNDISKGEGVGDQGFPPYNYTEPDSSDNPQQVDYDLDAAQGVNDTAADGPATATETQAIPKSILPHASDNLTGPDDYYTRTFHLIPPLNYELRVGLPKRLVSPRALLGLVVSTPGLALLYWCCQMATRRLFTTV